MAQFKSWSILKLTTCLKLAKLILKPVGPFLLRKFYLAHHKMSSLFQNGPACFKMGEPV